MDLKILIRNKLKKYEPMVEKEEDPAGKNRSVFNIKKNKHRLVKNTIVFGMVMLWNRRDFYSICREEEAGEIDRKMNGFVRDTTNVQLETTKDRNIKFLKVTERHVWKVETK